ncbi:MAG: hypothetical protein EXS15_04300 [Phycisphaerales bacterium]|nr:hypothetical protein [Phycisphaerales bacterium]
MPASRSRTVEWKRSMQQVFERGGTLEISVGQPGASDSSKLDRLEDADSVDLVWRLKIVSLDEESVLVEAPVALGQTMRIEDGMALVGAITIGQNRWRFLSKKLSDEHPEGSRGECMRLQLPDHVERCMRRFVRVEASALNLPNVTMWPLLDPRTIVAAEVANEIAFRAFTESQSLPSDTAPMPSVGPKFTATLVNIGGGGVGLRVEPQDASVLGRHRIFWLEIPLGRNHPVPIVVTGKVVHTHLDSSQRTYIGVSFDFTFQLSHQQVVADQIHRAMQSAQTRKEN